MKHAVFHPPFAQRRAAALVLALLAGSASAVTELAPVKVVASTPTQDDTLERQELTQQQAHDLSDIFESDPEISIGGGGNPITQKMYIRGVEESLLNLSIDGATINNKVYHHQTALILDPQLIKQVEVEKGTAAASAGPGALGGAIRYQTVSALDLLREGQNVGASLTGSVFSNEGWRSAATGYGRAGIVDALVSVTTMDTDDYKSGNGRTVPNSSTEQRNYLAKLGLQLSETQRLTAAYQRSSDEGVRTARANMVDFFHPVLPNDPIPQSLTRDTTTLNYEGRQLGFVDGVNATLYRSEVESERTNLKGRSWGETITTNGADVTLRNDFGVHSVKYGLNWRDEGSRANRIANPFNNTGSGREDLSVFGGFVEGAFEFGSVVVTGGLRYDDWDYTDNHGQNYQSDGVSPSASVSWQVFAPLELRAGYAKALRGVGLKEAFMLDIAQWKNEANIEAEEADNTEVGFRFVQGGFELKGNLYHQVIDNFITTYACPARRGGCRGNTGQAKVDGYELAAIYRIGALRTSLSVADADTEHANEAFGDGDLGLGTSTGRTWVTRVDYAIAGAGVQLGWMGRFVESLDYTAVGTNTQRTKPGYGVHDIYVSWQPLKKDTLTLNFAVKNVFDQQYYDQASYAWNGAQGKILGYAEPGRDVRVEANWTF
ncbi:TonB-dependent receptor domain-containing protein [Chitinibacteraceae bacterium HSL-7]